MSPGGTTPPGDVPWGIYEGGGFIHVCNGKAKCNFTSVRDERSPVKGMRVNFIVLAGIGVNSSRIFYDSIFVHCKGNFGSLKDMHYEVNF